MPRPEPQAPPCPECDKVATAMENGTKAAIEEFVETIQNDPDRDIIRWMRPEGEAEWAWSCPSREIDDLILRSLGIDPDKRRAELEDLYGYLRDHANWRQENDERATQPEH